MTPRLRFAPSPTGYLHVGGARTALFNWLYARRHGGTFILRIEDTDAERSSADMVTAIFDSLRWLGLDWDEGPGIGGAHGPYFQAMRGDLHRAAAERLTASGAAYPCYCSPDELQAKRAAAEAAGGAFLYDRTCRDLSAVDRAARAAGGRAPAIRFRVPAGETAFDDLVHGWIRVAHDTIDDFVIVRSDGSPTYQLSVVFDDIDMRITHVVRGDDHISNTPKQVLLYRALGAAVPQFAHVPLILGPDRKRLSKRHGATSVGEYEQRGYLPEAMINFLALLGWSPGSGDREVFSLDGLVSIFTLEGISGSNAVFNPEKLDWFSQQYLARVDTPDLIARLRARLEVAGLWRQEFESTRVGWMTRVLDLLKPRAHTLEDIVAQLRPFVADDVVVDREAAARHLGSPDIVAHLASWRSRIAGVEPFDRATLEAALRGLAEERGIKAGPLIDATRVAVVGQSASPGLFEVLELVGRNRVLARIDDVLATI